MKKQLLFVINSLVCGGAEKSLVSLLPLIDYDKYSVDLLMFVPDGMFIELLPDQVHILPQPEFFAFLRQGIFKQIKRPVWLTARLSLSVNLRINKKRGRPLHDAQVFWKCCGNSIGNLEKYYDAAIAWGQGNPTHFVAMKVKADKKIAWVNVNYTPAGHEKDFDYPHYRAFQYIVSVSDQLNEIMLTVFPDFSERMRVICDIQNDALILRMADLDAGFHPKAEIVLVTVGRLAKQKGYDIATAACKILKDRGLNFCWYIVGDGPECPNIKKEITAYNIGDYMTLLGAKANPYPYMKTADIYVQTSHFEGYCLTLAEARMLNKPIVTTEFDVVYSQMIHDKNGLVVSMKPEAVADGIIRLVKDRSLRNALIENLEIEKKGNTEEINTFYDLLGDKDEI